MHTSPSSPLPFPSLLFFVVFHTGAIQCYFSLPNCIDSIIYFVFAQFGMSIAHCQKIELLQKWSTFDINIPSIILYNNSLEYYTLARTHTQNLHYSPFIFPVNSTIRFSSSRTRAAGIDTPHGSTTRFSSSRTRAASTPPCSYEACPAQP